MDSETRQLLLESLTLARENNAMLRKMRSLQKWSKVWMIVKYVFLATLAFGAYKFLQPYLENLNNSLKSITDLSNFF